MEVAIDSLVVRVHDFRVKIDITASYNRIGTLRRVGCLPHNAKMISVPQGQKRANLKGAESNKGIDRDTYSSQDTCTGETFTVEDGDELIGTVASAFFNSESLDMDVVQWEDI